MWMKKKMRKSRLLYSMTGNRAVGSLRRHASLPPPPPSLAPGGRVRPSAGSGTSTFSEQAFVGARREENHGWSAQHLGSGPCSSFCFSAPEDSREEEETEFLLSSLSNHGFGNCFLFFFFFSFQFCIIAAGFSTCGQTQTANSALPFFMFKFLECGCFNTEHMEPNQAIFSQIAKQQQAWKKKTGISYSSGCCRGRTWLSSSNLVCQAPAPNPFLRSYFSLNALWKLWRCLNCARFVSNYAEEYRWWSRIWWLSDGILSAGLRRATINPLDLASM